MSIFEGLSNEDVKIMLSGMSQSEAESICNSSAERERIRQLLETMKVQEQKESYEEGDDSNPEPADGASAQEEAPQLGRGRIRIEACDPKVQEEYLQYQAELKKEQQEAMARLSQRKPFAYYLKASQASQAPSDELLSVLFLHGSQASPLPALAALWASHLHPGKYAFYAAALSCPAAEAPADASLLQPFLPPQSEASQPQPVAAVSGTGGSWLLADLLAAVPLKNKQFQRVVCFGAEANEVAAMLDFGSAKFLAAPTECEPPSNSDLAPSSAAAALEQASQQWLTALKAYLTDLPDKFVNKRGQYC